ncbi:hypothetical protein TSUD_13240 [Trifolium subterraneum]|uniref:Putative plant transposon protein domain-containing protein n=1 Tax=Trifolium subterraneum TaxID=3900 RepID=A0A2Z6NG92_TRISU|nr:hypothetical protein TSUD_13240 [Trifolium subterraneum]
MRRIYQFIPPSFLNNFHKILVLTIRKNIKHFLQDLSVVFDILSDGKYQDFVEVIQERGWDKLINPPHVINDDLVQEFYANAVLVDVEAPFSFTTMIRRHLLRFDLAAINAYLENPYTSENEDGLCPYARTLDRGNWNIDDIKQRLMMPDLDIQLNSAGLHLRGMRGDMKQKAQLTLLFILYNVIPRSHLSDAPMNILGLIYCLHVGKDVDVARVIANEMKVIASSGVTDQSKPKYCKLKRKEIPIAPTHPLTPHEVPPIDPTLQNWFHHTWDENVANHQVDVAMFEAMYRMSLQHPIDEPTMFQTHIALPADRPNFVGELVQMQ